jgi:hypothetical protein
VKVEPLLPDAPLPAVAPRTADAASFAQALDAVGSALGGAERAEDAFAGGSGTLQSAVYARARADVVLAVATAAAQRSAQAISSILNMQV